MAIAFTSVGTTRVDDGVAVAGGRETAIIGLADGGYAVAFLQSGSGGTRLWVQKVDSAGILVDMNGTTDGTTLELAAGGPNSGSHRSPNLAAFSDGGFVVVYDDTTFGSPAFRVVYQEFDASGAAGASGLVDPVAATDPPGDPRPHYTYSADVAVFPDDGFVTVHYDLLSPTQLQTDVFGGSGAAGTTLTLGAGDSPDQPSVAVLDADGYVVVWSDAGTGPTADIKAAIVDGGAVSTSFTVNLDTTGQQSLVYGNHTVAALSGGGFVVVWTSSRQIPPGSGNYDRDVFARVFAADGTPATGDIPVNDVTTSDQGVPEVAALPDGGFVVVWEGGYGAICARAFDAAGTARGPQATVEGGAYDPSVSVLENGQVVVAYAKDINGDGSGDEIRAERFTLVNVETGGAGNDALTGTAAGDRLEGLDGNDSLTGGDGADTLDGGAGRDCAVYGGATGIVVSLAAPGTNTGAAAGDTYIDVENLRGGDGADSLVGDADANLLDGMFGRDTLDGGAGDDTLNGGGGADRLRGGAGRDTYHVNVATDVIVEAGPAAERELVRATVSWTLGLNLDDLRLDGVASIAGTGNDLANGITGNGAANLLSGDLGADTLSGGGGNDTLLGGVGIDLLNGSAGQDA